MPPARGIQELLPMVAKIIRATFYFDYLLPLSLTHFVTPNPRVVCVYNIDWSVSLTVWPLTNQSDSASG